MGEMSKISWTDHTFNPWEGCARVSPGCLHCYAETRNKRFGGGLWGKEAPRRRTSPSYWQQPYRWDRAAAAAGVPAFVFCASLADVFEDRGDLLAWRSDLFDVMRATPHLVWLLLTKRPENVRENVPSGWVLDDEWPRNVWVGTTVEDQQRAVERLDVLAALPRSVTKFVSVEPLLGPLDLSRWLNLEWMDALDDPASARVHDREEGGWGSEMFATLSGVRPFVDWVIVGGESGHGYRPMNVDWARDVVTQCKVAGVPVWFKQHGGIIRIGGEWGGNRLDGELIHERPEP